MTTYITKHGKKISIRPPVEKYAGNLINYSKILFASTDQILTTLEEYTITVEQEKIWINNALQNPNALTLIAEISTGIIGLLFFVPLSKKKNCHTGEFGVNVHPAIQGTGIGRMLVKELLIWAKENSQIEKVFLNVFATNKNAIKLYNEMGFKKKKADLLKR